MAGRARAAELTWARCAEQMVDVYREVVGGLVPMTPLRVGVNLLWLVPGEVGGSEEYVCRLLEGVEDVDGDDLELTLFVNKRFWGAHPTIANTHRLEVAAISGRSRARGSSPSRRGWRLGTSLGVDLVHHPGGTVPVRTEDRCCCPCTTCSTSTTPSSSRR